MRREDARDNVNKIETDEMILEAWQGQKSLTARLNKRTCLHSLQIHIAPTSIAIFSFLQDHIG
jgi:hypothetical protein